ncbi:PP2C family protein-serine/threonine phosphatase [Streptomyces chattanoogensis]|uniref:PP2C family protein-serine/threonine phosphatase n=1 Tax=Streptomyces chattanoogensis TaxID=66876 RepID=UPI001FE09D79|nr:PP2C family protein-serine/threonine phosphatase [Streptomyces chattanoogensis]
MPGIAERLRPGPATGPPRLRDSGQWPRYVEFVPGVLVAGGLVWNAFSPQDYWGDPMLTAASVTAGALLSLRHTLAVGISIICGVFALTVKDGTADDVVGHLELINTLFAALMGVGVNRVIARHGRRLDVVRTVAEAAQHAVLPAPPERIGPLAIAARYQAAQSEARIGGDAYAVQRTPFGVRLLIADVRGKGLDAVSAVSVLLGAFREAAEQEPELPALADRMERALARASEQTSEEIRLEGFVTALICEVPPGGGVRLLDCGHPAPYLCHGGELRPLEAPDAGLPLGMGGLGVARPAPVDWPFPVGSTLLLVTDGVTEARDRAGAFFDPVAELAGLGPFEDPRELIALLVREVERWGGGPRDDDMAVLAITRTDQDGRYVVPTGPAA